MRILTLVISFAAFAYSQIPRTCVTPNGNNGQCIPFRSCDSLIRVLQSPNLNDAQRNFLKQSQCGHDGFQPYVCCQVAGAAAPKRTLPKAPQCGSDAQDRIVGGEATRIDEYPWLAQLGYLKGPSKKPGFHCGGSLINELYVLSAAHCVKKTPATWTLTKVRLGEWDTTTNPDCDDTLIGEAPCNEAYVDVPVAKVIVHENYDPNSKNQHHDIVLLKLANEVRYTDFIKPVCLPLDTNLKSQRLNNNVLIVAGWGKTETSSASDKKLKVSVTAYSNADCQRVYGPSGNTIIDGQMCAGGEAKKDSCNGDSGGPLMKHQEFYQGGIPHIYLAGIVSYGPRNCGTQSVPGVYTRVSSYIDWIQSNME